MQNTVRPPHCALGKEPWKKRGKSPDICIRNVEARLKAGTWVCYVRLQPTCSAIQLLCSSLLISQHLCGCSYRLSKSLCESSSPRVMNLFVQERTGLNQLIHFSDVVGRNKYMFHNLPLSWFLARLCRMGNLILLRDTHSSCTVLSGRESCIDTVDGRQSWSPLQIFTRLWPFQSWTPNLILF